MVNRIRTIYACGLNKEFSLRLCAGSRVQYEIPEESRRMTQLKCCESNNEDEDNRPNILSDKKIHLILDLADPNIINFWFITHFRLGLWSIKWLDGHFNSNHPNHNKSMLVASNVKIKQWFFFYLRKVVLYITKSQRRPIYYEKKRVLVVDHNVLPWIKNFLLALKNYFYLGAGFVFV